MKNPRDWVAVGCVLIAGIAAFVWKVRIVAPIEYVGHADASGYAEMADSILKGRGLEVDYVSWYFRKYESIERPEDHWPPFYSFLIVPFFLFMGKTAFAAKLPSLLISAFAFPLTLYALAWRVARSRAVAVASGLSILIYAPVFGWSLHCLSDVTFGFLITAAIYAAIKGCDDSRWFWAMGALLASAYYAKGSTVVLLPAFVAYYTLWRLFARPRWKWMPRDRNFAIGVALFALLLVPWIVRNLIHFGVPLYSTQNHAAGYIGWKGWEEGTYTLYWGENVPSLHDKAANPERWVEKSGEFFQRHFWWLFMRMNRNWGDFDRRDLSTYATGIPALIGVGFFALTAALGLFVRWRRKSKALGLWRWARPFFRPEYSLFLLVGVAHIAFLSICWQPISRLTTPVIPLVMLIGYATVWTCVERAMSDTRWARALAVCATVALFALWATPELGDLANARKNSGYPWKDGSRGWMEVGKWIRANAPGSITMTRNPWELHFYSEEKAVQIPLASLDRIVEVARYYGATHLIPENRRPTLKPWIDGEVPGLRKLTESGGVQLYEIDYSALPPDL